MLKKSWVSEILVVSVVIVLGGALLKHITNQQDQAVAPPKVVAVKNGADPKFQNKLVQILNNDNYSGTAMMYKNGRLVASYYAGYADYLSDNKNQRNTMYEIDSIQKSITAVLVMQQVAQHKLALTDHLSQFYPSVPGSKNITIRQMLNMTSGLVLTGPVGPPIAESDTQIIQSDISRVHYLAIMHGHWNYQGVNFNLLCGILEKITQQSYQQLFTTQIIQKLHLKYTEFAYTLPTSAANATGYTGLITTPKDAIYTKPSTRNQALERNELGSGQVYMSAGDLYHVESAILAGKVVPLAALKQLYQDASYSKYAAGFYVQPNVKSANGAGYGFESSIHISPNGKDALILLSNYQAPLFKTKSLAQKFDYLLFN
ncbi:serine hydrolase domain-containing protein [Loigolactobacillus zhaoyuanensis]|uniref:Serine hydrolase domain-containing protein n=1 Tax=Loigolactobacillus zhaoyuanensis TaxID=2486017 RepID=A0ABW8U9M1_9LACO